MGRGRQVAGGRERRLSGPAPSWREVEVSIGKLGQWHGRLCRSSSTTAALQPAAFDRCPKQMPMRAPPAPTSSISVMKPSVTRSCPASSAAGGSAEHGAWGGGRRLMGQRQAAAGKAGRAAHQQHMHATGRRQTAAHSSNAFAHPPCAARCSCPPQQCPPALPAAADGIGEEREAGGAGQGRGQQHAGHGMESMPLRQAALGSGRKLSAGCSAPACVLACS